MVFLQGINTTALSVTAEWDFAPMQSLRLGTHITGGDIYGTVQENRMIKHKVLYDDIWYQLFVYINTNALAKTPLPFST